MRILTIAAVSLILAAGCGGKSGSNGSQGGRVNGGDAGAEEDDDEDRGRGDDDGARGDDDRARGDDDGRADDDAEPEPEPEPEPTADDDAKPEPEPAADDEPAPRPRPEPTPDPDCETISLSTTPTSCDIREQCTDAYRYTYCSETVDGEWSCTCSDGFAGHELVVSADSAPCRMVASACPDINASAFTGESDCAVEYQSSTTSSCETQQRCSQALDINPDIKVVESQYQYASCYDNGTGGLSCSCSGPYGTKSFTIEDSRPQDACDPASALCSGRPVMAGDESCTVNYEYAGSSYCQRQQTCTETVTVDGVQATLSGTETGSCSTSSDGKTACSCYNTSRSYSFEIGAPANDPDTCVTAMEVCDATELPVPSGDVECTLVSQSASTSYCEASTQCTQDAVINGVSIGLYGTVYTYCQPNGDEWLCQCSSGAGSATVDVAADDAWGACDLASTECPELVPIQVGSSGTSPCYVTNASGDAAIAIPCAY